VEVILEKAENESFDGDYPSIEPAHSLNSYEAVEVHGIKEVALQDGGLSYEHSDEPDFVSVFLRLKGGSTECVADLASFTEAHQFAMDVAKKYNLQY
jgi:hypothetical protein